MRLFYAIGPWDQLGIREYQRYMGAVPQLRWVAKDQIHLTLNFLGEVDDAALRQTADKLAEVAAQHPSFTLRWSRPGVFPGGQAWRVFWIGLDREAATHVVRISRDLGNNRPSPHVTVARVKGPLPDEVTARWHTVPVDWPEIQVDEIRLVKSTLTPTGPIYEVVRSERLKR